MVWKEKVVAGAMRLRLLPDPSRKYEQRLVIRSLCTSEEQPLQLAYNLAREKLSGMDIRQQCSRSGAQYVHPDTLIMEYLNRSYVMAIPGMEISLRDSPGRCEGKNCVTTPERQESRETIDLTDRILILHYLITAKGTPPTGKLIGLRQVSGGLCEHANFSREVLTPLLDHFGKEPARLVEAAAKLGGCRAGYGDVAVSIKAFPRVSVVMVLWRGDDEFPSNANILFDSTVTDYLSTEDMSVLCERIVEKLTQPGQDEG
jgi:hypothetical protein